MFAFIKRIVSTIREIVSPPPAQSPPTPEEIVLVEEVPAQPASSLVPQEVVSSEEPTDQSVPPPVPQPKVKRVRPKKPKVPMDELTHGWYFDKDVESWRRRSKGTGSDWNPAGRRLRTLLIRMVARGNFETETVPLDRLWTNLPAPFEEEMKQDIELLIERGLLHEASQTEQESRYVSLNSEMLPEIQDLINRTVSPFWADIVGEQ